MRHHYFNLSIFFILFFFATLFPVLGQAQNVSVTDDQNYTAHSSAMLDVKANDKGMLVPRLTTMERLSITSPADGLLVYDKDLKNFFYYAGNGWLSLPKAGTTSSGDALFEIKDNQGNTVFAVYNDGVKITIPDSSFEKGNAGGFAVSGRSTGKGVGDIFRVTPDSTRVYVQSSAKGNAGGFAVSGRSTAKGADDQYLSVAPGGTQVRYDPLQKGIAGGFAVSGRSTGKAAYNKIFNISKNNYFIGHQAGSNTTEEDKSSKATPYGKYNSFLGYQAGYANTSGYNNLYLGYQTGYANKAGHSNVYVGGFSGREQTSGSQNVFVGHETGLQNNGTGNVFVGHQAGLYLSGDNQLAIDNSDTKLPLIGGDFSNDILNFAASAVIVGFKEPLDNPEMLNVNGNIAFTGDLINLKGKYEKPDYVFDEDYDHRFTILEVDQFIQENKHLPWVTPKDAEGYGTNITRMTYETLETTENLQLQIIDLKKEKQKLKDQVNNLEQRISELEDLIKEQH